LHGLVGDAQRLFLQQHMRELFDRCQVQVREQSQVGAQEIILLFKVEK
jgi:hypothetical protein